MLPQPWLLRQFPVSQCLCFKSLCPRVSLALFGFGIGQQGCVSQKWALANIPRKGHLITKASYRHPCIYGAAAAVLSASRNLLCVACSLPPWCLSWPRGRITAASCVHSTSPIFNWALSILPYALSFLRLCLLFPPCYPIGPVLCIALKR